jgi:predicted nucleic acid-binding protein
MPTLLISDTNILMDVEAGGLATALFSLDYTFAVPDILFEEELAANFGHLAHMGLQVKELSPDVVRIAERLAQHYRRVSGNDRLALALALGEGVGLLTGDQLLKKAAEGENVQVRGTVWLLQEMIRERRITLAVALSALDRMRDVGRRLPWELAKRILQGTEASDQLGG